MLKLTIEMVSDDDFGRRRTIASMTIADRSPVPGIDGRDVTVIEAGDAPSGRPAKLWSCVIQDVALATSVWPMVRAAIDAMDGAECAGF